MSPSRSVSHTRALVAFTLSAVTIVIAVVLATRRFPGGFDWVYTVMSALASRKHNPDGSVFFAAGLVLSLALLWPATAWIREFDGAAHRLARFGLRSLQLGIILGVVVGLERLFFFDFSQIVCKGHEVLALLSFVSLYAGVPALQIHRVRLRQVSSWPALVAIGPLVAIGLSQLGLYLDQRDLGWVDTSWREMGVPVWLSFAFWQWLATAALWASVGHLVVSGRSSRVKVPAQSRASENEPRGQLAAGAGRLVLVDALSAHACPRSLFTLPKRLQNWGGLQRTQDSPNHCPKVAASDGWEQLGNN